MKLSKEEINALTNKIYKELMKDADDSISKIKAEKLKKFLASKEGKMIVYLKKKYNYKFNHTPEHFISLPLRPYINTSDIRDEITISCINTSNINELITTLKNKFKPKLNEK